MKDKRVSFVLAVVGMLFLSLSNATAQTIQDRAARADERQTRLAEAAKGKPTPRTPDGRPDFSGFFNGYNASDDPTSEFGAFRLPDGSVLYQHIGANDAQQHVPRPTDFSNAAPYKPEYLAKVKEIAATAYGGTTALDPQMDCKPMGIPRGGIGTMQIVQTPELITILYEKNPGYNHRIIYMNGKHPEDLETSHMGHSVGHWEGDTLVVDVAGLNDDTWLGGGQGTANLSTIHSDQLHVIERWTRNGDVITYNATVEDPVMFTRPWVIEPRTARLAPPGDYMQAMPCLHTSVGGKNRKEHMVQESENDKFLCGWCRVGADYGLDSNAPTTGEAVPEVLKEAAEQKYEEGKEKFGGK
jgi:hypothetical protein